MVTSPVWLVMRRHASEMEWMTLSGLKKMRQREKKTYILFFENNYLCNVCDERLQNAECPVPYVTVWSPCVCVCVCVRERERERQRDGNVVRPLQCPFKLSPFSHYAKYSGRWQSLTPGRCCNKWAIRIVGYNKHTARSFGKLASCTGNDSAEKCYELQFCCIKEPGLFLCSGVMPSGISKVLTSLVFRVMNLLIN